MNKILSRIAFLTTKQVGIIALFCGAFYWYALFDDGSSLDPQIANLNQQLQEQVRKKGETEAALKKRDNLKEILTNLTAKYENLSRLVPIELNSSDLNRQLDQLRKTSRVSQISRKPDQIVKGPILDEWPVQMSFQGAYNDIAQFVYQASTTEKVMLVKKIKISSPEAAATQSSAYDGKLNFDVTISAVKVASAEAAAAPAVAPVPPPATPPPAGAGK
jgi:Tfp pilus assembly protein PilO